MRTVGQSMLCLAAHVESREYVLTVLLITGELRSQLILRSQSTRWGTLAAAAGDRHMVLPVRGNAWLIVNIQRCRFTVGESANVRRVMPP